MVDYSSHMTEEEIEKLLYIANEILKEDVKFHNLQAFLITLYLAISEGTALDYFYNHVHSKLKYKEFEK